jgi:hypothetical protein
MQAYIIPEVTTASDFYTIGLIATNESNGDLLYAVDGAISIFEEDYPDAKEYYEANWFQNVYPNAPGDTPLEKYLNALTNMTEPNPPKWANIMPAISNSSLFAKLLTTQNPNAFSALQTAIQYRNMALFKTLAKATIEGIPGGLSQEEIEELGGILADNNFPCGIEL